MFAYMYVCMYEKLVCMYCTHVRTSMLHEVAETFPDGIIVHCMMNYHAR